MPPFSLDVWRRAVGRLERYKTVAVLAAMIALTSSGTAAAAVLGDPLKLGIANSINALTTWSGSLADKVVQIQNTSTAAGARALGLYSKGPWGTASIANAGTGPALQLQVGAGRAPIMVNADAGKAINLNADKLDGQDSSAFFSGGGYIKSGAVALTNNSISNVLQTAQLTVSYHCPDNLAADGMFEFQNGGETVNYFSDNGGTNPVFGSLGPWASWFQSAAPSGEHITFQVQGSFIATVEAFSLHRASDCHTQAQIVMDLP